MAGGCVSDAGIRLMGMTLHEANRKTDIGVGGLKPLTVRAGPPSRQTDGSDQTRHVDSVDGLLHATPVRWVKDLDGPRGALEDAHLRISSLRINISDYGVITRPT